MKKRCRVCRKTKDSAQFSLVSKATGTRRTICKVCNNNASKKYQARNRAIKSTARISEKKCSRCKKVKSVNKFSKDSSTNSGWRAICKSCASTTFQVWRKTHKK